MTIANHLKAIPTIYQGVSFRSRLEARWAVFFCRLGIVWDYEKEAFSLDGGRIGYTPDFWLPYVSIEKGNQGCWFEVKPELPAGKSYGSETWCEITDKPERFAMETSEPIYVAFGTPERSEIELFWQQIDGDSCLQVHWDNDREFRQCPHCHVWTLQFQGAAGRHCNVDPEYISDARVTDALAFASRYRFWNPA